MEFTYHSYRFLLKLLMENGYAFSDYKSYQNFPRCVIMRHDIDSVPKAALPLAEIEKELGISSTWFVLLTSDFYNPMAPSALSVLRKLREMGHEIGLHYDEAAYEPVAPEETVSKIVRECALLSEILGAEVRSVSMHRPSPAMLEADLKIPGIVNSYGKTFFREFKYLSDSRRRWREPVLDIIQSGQYDRLHILTHAFWYHEKEQTISETVGNFIRSANGERYEQMRGNIKNLEEIVNLGGA